MIIKNISIGIDATSIVDGVGFTHLKKLLVNYHDQKSTHKLIICATKKVLDQLPNHPLFWSVILHYLTNLEFTEFFSNIFIW